MNSSLKGLALASIIATTACNNAPPIQRDFERELQQTGARTVTSSDYTYSIINDEPGKIACIEVEGVQETYPFLVIGKESGRCRSIINAARNRPLDTAYVSQLKRLIALSDSLRYKTDSTVYVSH